MTCVPMNIVCLTGSFSKVPPYALVAVRWPPKLCWKWSSLGTSYAAGRADELSVTAETDIAKANLALLLWAHLDGPIPRMVQLLDRHCRWLRATTCWSLSFWTRAYAGFVSPIREVPPLFCYFAYDTERRAIPPESHVDRMGCHSRPNSKSNRTIM